MRRYLQVVVATRARPYVSCRVRRRFARPTVTRMRHAREVEAYTGSVARRRSMAARSYVMSYAASRRRSVVSVVASGNESYVNGAHEERGHAVSASSYMC